MYGVKLPLTFLHMHLLCKWIMYHTLILSTVLQPSVPPSDFFVLTTMFCCTLCWQYAGGLGYLHSCHLHLDPPHAHSQCQAVRQSGHHPSGTSVNILYYTTRVHLRLTKVFVTHKQNMIRWWNLYQLTSLDESQICEAHGCKPWIANLSTIPIN